MAQELMRKLEAVSLRLAVWMPFLYAGNLAFSSLFYPGYSQSRQMVSELGAQGAPHPAIFNVGVFLIGITILIGAFGFFRALRRLGAKPIWVWLTSSVLVLSGLATLMAGLYPLPDPRHDGKYLGLVIILGPVSLATALWRLADARPFIIYLLATNLLMIVMLAILMGVGGFATAANVGFYQRAYALAAFPWIGAAAYALKVWVLRYSPPHLAAERSGDFDGSVE